MRAFMLWSAADCCTKISWTENQNNELKGAKEESKSGNNNIDTWFKTLPRGWFVSVKIFPARCNISLWVYPPNILPASNGFICRLVTAILPISIIDACLEFCCAFCFKFQIIQGVFFVLFLQLVLQLAGLHRAWRKVTTFGLPLITLRHARN